MQTTQPPASEARKKKPDLRRDPTLIVDRVTRTNRAGRIPQTIAVIRPPLSVALTTERNRACGERNTTTGRAGRSLRSGRSVALRSGLTGVAMTTAMTSVAMAAVAMAAVAMATAARVAAVATTGSHTSEQTTTAMATAARVAAATVATVTTVTVATAAAVTAMASQYLVVTAQKGDSDDREKDRDPEGQSSIHPLILQQSEYRREALKPTLRVPPLRR